jgi:copper transporter 1
MLTTRTKLPIQARLIRAGIYALLVAMSYWVSPLFILSSTTADEQLMLVAMTYNSYLCGSIVIGAFTGHMLYESEMDVG